MLATNYSSLRDNLKAYCDKITDEGETIIITRKDDKNVVMISLDEWNELQRIAKNAEYLSKLDRSIRQLADGKTITKTIEELEAMEYE